MQALAPEPVTNITAGLVEAWSSYSGRAGLTSSEMATMYRLSLGMPESAPAESGTVSWCQ